MKYAVCNLCGDQLASTGMLRHLLLAHGMNDQDVDALEWPLPGASSIPRKDPVPEKPEVVVSICRYCGLPYRDWHYCHIERRTVTSQMTIKPPASTCQHTPPYTPPYPTVYPVGPTVTPWQTGWVCPKCGRVWSPTTSTCVSCYSTSTPTAAGNSPG